MPLTLDELDSHLFKCADIIRDAVDPTDYKELILPLVYYKSISDEFEEQYQENLEDYGEDFARIRISTTSPSFRMGISGRTCGPSVTTSTRR